MRLAITTTPVLSGTLGSGPPARAGLVPNVGAGSGLQQSLTATLPANTVRAFRVDVGNRLG